MTYFVVAVKARGFKLQDLAEAVGVCPSALSDRIHGRTSWGWPEVLAACRTLGMSLDEFAAYFPR